MERHLAFLTEYDGSCWHGWQRQKNAPTVQAEMEAAWREMTGEQVTFRGSSRTDTGVSARGHVADVFTDTHIPPERLVRVFNSYLPPSIRVRDWRIVPSHFQANYRAVGKLYLYNLWRPQAASALLRRVTTPLPRELNIPLMRKACRIFEGLHDFTACMDQGSPPGDTRRTLDRLLVLDRGPCITIACLGQGFLYHQVRILAGSLVYVGLGKLTLEQVAEAFQAKNRPGLGKTMPPEGLLLYRVYYPEELFGGDGESDYRQLCHQPAENFPDLCQALLERL